MTDALWVITVSSLIAICCSLIGTILVLRRMAMLSDAISHAVLPGIVVAYYFARQMDYGLFLVASIVTAFVATLLIEGISRLANFRKDVSMGIIYTLLFSIGIIILSANQDKIPLKSDFVIQGNLEFVPFDLWIYKDQYSLGPYPLWSSLINLLLILGVFLFGFRGIQLVSFDEQFARVKGFATKGWNLMLMALTSVTVVISFDSVGAILVIGFIVVPPATALLLTNRLINTLLISSILGVISSVLGFYLSAYFNLSIAGSICFVMGVLFMIVFLSDRIRKKILDKGNGKPTEHTEQTRPV